MSLISYMSKTIQMRGAGYLFLQAFVTLGIVMGAFLGEIFLSSTYTLD